MGPKKEDWLKKKDRNQRRPGSRRSQEDGGGACELPLRAGPAALHKKQQSCSSTLVGGRGEAWPPVVGLAPAIGGHAASVSRPRVSSCNGPLTTSTITLTITSLTLFLVG